MSEQNLVSEEEPLDGWSQVKLDDVVTKRAENVDPDEVDIDRHVGLEHIQPNTPTPDWEPIENVTSTKRRFYPGDILFAKLRPNLEKAAQPQFDGVSSTDIFTIEAKEGINSKYLLYRLSSKPVFDWARRTSAGTRMPRTSWGQFKNFEFGLPPIEEQRRIASVLVNADAALQQTEQIIEQTHRVKKGVVQDVFKRGVRSHDEFEDTAIGSIPAGWEVCPIGDVVNMAQYGISESMSSEGEYPVFRMNNIENGYMVDSPLKYLDLPDEEFEKYRVEQGDILFNRTNSHELVGKTGIFELEGDYVFASYLVRLRTNEHADPYYLNYYMNSKKGQDRLKAFATKGVGQSNINAQNVQRVLMPRPPVEEQREIAEIIRQFDQQIEVNKQHKSQLQRIKQGLLQDLLSGDVRAHSDSIDVAEVVAQYE